MLTNVSKIIFEQTKTRRQRKLILFAFISAGNLRRLQHLQLAPAPGTSNNSYYVCYLFTSLPNHTVYCISSRYIVDIRHIELYLSCCRAVSLRPVKSIIILWLCWLHFGFGHSLFRFASLFSVPFCLFSFLPAFCY